MAQSRYEQRGVSAAKEDVHQAIKKLDKGLFPSAFCKILPDSLTGSQDHCLIIHADGAGTKSSLAYAYYNETGDYDVWAGIAQDAIVMNLDDMICAGATGPFLLSSTIGRNKNKIGADIISALINGSQDFVENMKNHGVDIHFGGGETADVGDLVRTIIVDSTMSCRMKRSDVISNEKMQPGDVIIGLASYGKTSYENEYNGGMGSNGLTSARHDVFNKYIFEKYPETCDAEVPENLRYSGSRLLTEKHDDLGIDIGKLVLSPTRTYAPFLLPLLKSYRDQIHGMIHCTGGAQTKILKFCPQLRVVKDNLFKIPPLFKLIMQESGTEYKEMYQVFNMGHRMELVVPAEFAADLIEMASTFAIEAQIVGHLTASDKRELVIESPEGTILYS